MIENETKRQTVDDIDEEFECTAIDRIATRVYGIAADHGFHEGETPGEDPTLERISKFIANLHEECSEFWAAARAGKLYDQCDKPVALTNAEEELADIVIRAMDTAHTMGISLGAAIYAKSRYNRSRPYKHGKNC